MGPGELWERIPADPGIDFFLKIPVGKDPGNLRVHPCPALAPFRISDSKADFRVADASLSLLINCSTMEGREEVVEVEGFSSENPLPLRGRDAGGSMSGEFREELRSRDVSIVDL